ncbi:TetR/AcrR family transcriptional regulator [Homoserinimonas sp. A447]
MNLATSMAPSGRARPLPVDERRAMIIHAITPLLLTHGRDVTSRQLAEAAGIAEGTIYRAFGDKESLIEAAIAHYLDPEPMRFSLRAIDPDLPLETKIFAIVHVLRERFNLVFRIMAVLGAERPPMPSQRKVYSEIIGQCLAPDLARLNWPPEQVGHVIRLITFSAAFPQLNDGVEFTTEQLSAIVLYGVAGSAPCAHTESN